jgi:hypothetical protein
MKTVRREPSLWLPAGLGVLVFSGVLGLALHFVRLPHEVQVKSEKPVVPGANLIALNSKGGDKALLDQATLLDPRPLFLPTPFNTSQPSLPISTRREPGQVFPLFGSKLTFVEANADLRFPPAVTAPEDPAKALEVGHTANPFFDYGRQDDTATAVPARVAYLEVLQAKTGHRMLTQPLVGVDSPALQADWHPMELLAVVDRNGLVIRPTIVSGSGNDEVDSFLRNFLAKGFRLGEHLTPGIYALRVGP